MSPNDGGTNNIYARLKQAINPPIQFFPMQQVAHVSWNSRHLLWRFIMHYELLIKVVMNIDIGRQFPLTFMGFNKSRWSLQREVYNLHQRLDNEDTNHKGLLQNYLFFPDLIWCVCNMNVIIYPLVISYLRFLMDLSWYLKVGWFANQYEIVYDVWSRVSPNAFVVRMGV